MKIYLRAYVNWYQNDWMNHLLIVEFENNFNVNAFTTIKSFEVTKNYLSRSSLESFKLIEVIDSIARREMRDVDKWVEKMKRFRVYLREQLKWTQIKMTKIVDTHKQSISKFKVKKMIIFDVRYQNIKRNNKSFDYKNLKLNLIQTNLENDVWIVDEILKFRIDRRRNDSTTRIKSCLMYKIKW